MAGTTRDALARPVEWGGRAFDLVDTGGLFGASEDPLHELVVEQGKRALAGADIVVFVVDGREGLVSADERIARELHETGRPVILAINKTDDKRSRASIPEFFSLGFDPVIEISAEHGDGVAELLDAVVAALPVKGRASDATTGRASSSPAHDRDADDDSDAVGAELAPPAGRKLPFTEERETRIAIVGRPNVGKSSLVNRLLRAERVLVSEIPGTTRDAIDIPLSWHHRRFRIVDTAGMRRPGRVGKVGPRGETELGKVEAVSVALAKKSIADADVVALVIDAREGATDQDAAIGGEADRAGRGIVIVANKWDLVKQTDSNFVNTFDDALRRKMRFLDYAPILHVSALTGERAPKIIETLDKIAAARNVRIPTPRLNKFVEDITAANPPVSPDRRHVRILYAAQIGAAPPSFVFFTNVATTFHFSYQRFLINKIREEFGFVGSPIRIQVRRRGKDRGARRKRPPH
jgi:GTP-binding protein